MSQFLESRFSNSVTFKGTRRNHEFIPCGNNITKSIVSGNHTAKLLLQNDETSISIEDILPGSYYACRYDNDWYFGVANYVSDEHSDVNVKFPYSKGLASQFFWLRNDYIFWIPIESIMTRVDPPSSESTSGRFYRFSCDDIKHVQSLMRY